MVDFKTKVYYEENNKIIGAEVIVYSGEGDRIGNIQITSKKDFDDLINRIDSFDEIFIAKNDLQNLVDKLIIDAATLDGYSSSDFASRDHSHNREYAKTNHADSENIYGLASSSLFGHVKTVNNLNQTSFKEGFALAANQGKILNDNINNVVKNNRTWSKVKETDNFTLWYNSSTRICYAEYNRDDYIGFSNPNNVNKELELHGGAVLVPSTYQPHVRVTTSLYRPDVNIHIENDGTIHVRSLTQIAKIGIHASFMWVVL